MCVCVCAVLDNLVTLVFRGSSHCVMADMMHCEIRVDEFQLLSCYSIHFQTNILGKGMNPLIPLARDKIVPLLFFYTDEFSIK